MIIFDLDGTLANCEHRRHFVDEDKAVEKGIAYEDIYADFGGIQSRGYFLEHDPDRRWRPDWKAFFEDCDKDTPIEPVVAMWNQYETEIACDRVDIQIWSGRCESVRSKTLKWLSENLFIHSLEWLDERLKMRPFRDYTPDDQLKEKWLDEALAEGKTIDYVFDDRPKVIEMWRRRGIFVFNCNQTGEEF